MASPEARRREYLRALDIDVYTLRGAADEAEVVEPAVDAGGLDWSPLREAVAGCTACTPLVSWTVTAQLASRDRSFCATTSTVSGSPAQMRGGRCRRT